jgi:hypothetical protein
MRGSERCHHLVGGGEHQLGERGVGELAVPQLVDERGLDRLGVAGHALGEAGEAALAAAIRIVGLFQ